MTDKRERKKYKVEKSNQGECACCCTRRSTFACDDAVVHRTLVLIALYRSHCFQVCISVAIFQY